MSAIAAIVSAIIAGLVALLGAAGWRNTVNKGRAQAAEREIEVQQAEIARTRDAAVAAQKQADKAVDLAGKRDSLKAEQQERREEIREDIKKGKRDHFGSQPR